MTWQTLTLGEVCDAGGGEGEVKTGPFGSQLHESDYSDTGTPVVMPKDIIEGRVSERSVARVSDDHVARLAQHQLVPGDIVYGRRGDIGRQALITERERGWLCGTGCLRVTLGASALDPTYLHYYLRDSAVIEGIAQQAIGATMPNLNTGILRGIRVRFPLRIQQRRIATILSAYDDLIENNTRRIAILEEMARRIYEEWFVRFRFPGFEAVRMVESELGLVPEGWQPASVADVAAVSRGRSYKGTELADEGGLPFVNLKCMERDGGFRASGLKRYTGNFKESQTVRPGDMVMGITDMTQERRIVARVGRVSGLDAAFGVFSMDLVRIASRGGHPDLYLYAMFRWSGFADEVKQHANGANVLHLLPARIEEYRFALPPPALAVRFAELVGPMFSLCETLTQKNANLRTTRDLLLPKLISGELDVSAMPEPEPLTA